MKKISKKLNIILLFGLVFFLSLSLMSQVNADVQNEIIVSSDNNLRVIPNQQFETSIYLENASNIVGLQFGFLYDQTMFTLENVIYNGEIDGDFVVNKDNSGEFNITFGNVTAPINGLMSLFTLVFIPTDLLAMGETPLLEVNPAFDQLVTSIDEYNDIVPINQVTFNLNTVNKGIIGDVNWDGYVDVLDVAYIQQHIVGLRTLDEDSAILADVNFDDYIDIIDVSLIQQYIVNLIDSFTKPDTLIEFSEPVQIDFWEANGSTVGSKLDFYAQEFESMYPNVEINIVKAGNNYDDLNQNFNASYLSNSNVPNIIQGYPDHIYEYSSKDMILPLTNYTSNQEFGFSDLELNDFVISFLNESRQFDSLGTLYSLPFVKTTEVMIYNKTLIDALILEGVITEIPTTWQGLFAIADDLRRVAVDEGIIDQIIDILISSGNITLTSSERQLIKDNFVPISYDDSANAFITLSRHWGGDYINRDNQGNVSLLFDNTSTRSALGYFYDYRDNGITFGNFTVPERWGINYTSDVFKFAQNAVNIISLAGIRYNIPETVDGSLVFDLGFAPIPYNGNISENRGSIQQGTDLALVNSGTEQEKLASWLFIKYLTSKEVQLDFSINTGYLPVRYSVYQDPVFENFIDGLDSFGMNLETEKLMYSRAMKVTVDKLDYLFFEPAFIGGEDVRTIIDQTFNDIILNTEGTKESIIDAAIANAISNAENIIYN